MERTIFEIPKMDCPSEERLVRMALRDAPIEHLAFDLVHRRLTVLHTSSATCLLKRLEPLKFDARIAETGAASPDSLGPDQPQTGAGERSTLILLLAINAAMFVAELVAGLIAESTGLIADSLDMFADATVYGISFYAIEKSLRKQVQAARLSGYLQMLLATGAFGEVLRRFLFGSAPEAPAMMGIAALALIANVACMALIAKHREGGVHMRASWIFSTNDVIANLGVIAAGALVAWTGSSIPDLVIGTIIAAVVFSGAVRILKLSEIPAA